MRTASWTESVTVLDRLSAVLDAFGDDGEGLTVSELARRAHLPKSTVSRIAADLVDEGYLDREGALLYLGIRLFELGQSVERPRRLRELARPTMARLRDATGCHVQLAVADGADVVVIANAHGRGARPAARIGERLPLASTALGAACSAIADQAGARPDTPTAHEVVHGDHTCMASPVIVRGEVVAALSISGEAGDVDFTAAAPLLCGAAAALGRASAA